MKLKTEITFEVLAKHLKLEHGLEIQAIDVDNIKGSLVVVVNGDVPTRTVTKAGFYPSPKYAGKDPDEVYLSYLQQKPS